ncbi:MAG: hydroxymethylbilane synthase [Fidelibacterota bacterium]
MSDLTIGSRGSRLSLWQAHYVRDRIVELDSSLTVTVISITTRGDKDRKSPLPQIGDKGVFTAEIESALKNGEIDLAVHSLKDLPVVLESPFTLGAVPPRESAMDVLVSSDGSSFDDLPPEAVIATGSVRRRAQLLHIRPDLRFVDIRGNIETRLKKLKKERWHGLIMAEAALHRLELMDIPYSPLGLDVMVPAAGQGAVAVEVREDREDLKPILEGINNIYSFQEVETELHFIALAEGGCKVPAGAYAEVNRGGIHLTGFVSSLDGKHLLRNTVSGPVQKRKDLAQKLFDTLTARGAQEILASARGVLE